MEDMKKIQELFGKSFIQEMGDNKETFIENIEYVVSLGYKDVFELVEHYPETFLIDSITFKEKVDHLLESLGVESFEKIEENIEIWESINEN